MKNSLRSDILTAYLSALIAFHVVPVFMIGQAPDDFHFVNYSTLLSSGLIFVIVIGGLSSLTLALLHRLRLEKTANGFSLFVLAWIVVAGFALPVCTSAGMMDPEDIPTNRLNFAIVTILSTGMSFLAGSRSRKWVVTFLSAVVISAVVASVVSIYASTDGSAASHDHFLLSRIKNIVVVSFDGLPATIVSDLIRTDVGYSSTFKDFTLFENAVSQSPATEASLMGELYGVRDYKTMGDGQSVVARALERDLTKSLLTSVVQDSHQYGYPLNSVKRIALQPPSTASEDDYLNKIETFDFFRYSIVRLGTNRALRFSRWTEWTGQLKAYLIRKPSAAPLATKLENHVGPSWDKPLIADVTKYDYWVDNLRVSDKQFSIRLLHFTFTHFPVDFDSTCAFRSDDRLWYDAHQNEDGIRSQTICALNKFARFLRRLKDLGIYERSLVVLKSDHGEPTHYFSTYPGNVRINGHPTWGYSRYRPALMIKDFGATNSTVTYENQLVLLNDLAKTLCANSGLAIRCDHFNGVDLLSKDLKSVDEPYFIYVVKNAESDFRFDAHLSVRIPSRKLELIEAMASSPLISLSPSIHEAGSTSR
jgi:hypothetical protein